MEIHRFSKLSNGIYKVDLGNVEIEVHEDLILKYDLLLKKEISDDLLLILEQEQQQYQVYNIAIRELKKRLRCEKELVDILLKKEIDRKTIDSVIALLYEQGYLNDEVYLDSYIHDRILLSSDGPLKIQKDLLEKGFPLDQIQLKLGVFTEELERERVQKIVQKHLKHNLKSLSSFCLKLQQILRRFGYHDFIISSVLSQISVDDESLKKKEYDKLYRKLSSKYQGDELERRIQQKLYQKGFRA